ncbi:MAG: 50S ribosomal protein L19 [Ignavibacteria bacterium]|nr:50S ribosomal protein L19 [Ignavibacteria bacterium]
MDKINLVTAAQIKSDIPVFHPGDTVTVSVKVIEGEKERLQQFKGIVMGIRGGGLSKSFRVRKISNGIGVERIFPLHSPKIANIEINKEGSVRRAKLYYLRKLKGKAATKIKEKKKVTTLTEATSPTTELTAAEKKEPASKKVESKQEGKDKPRKKTAEKKTKTTKDKVTD